MAEITVEPHMVERTIPGYFNRFEHVRVPARTVQERRGYMARRGSIQGWSMDPEKAKQMVERIEKARADQSGGEHG